MFIADTWTDYEVMDTGEKEPEIFPEFRALLPGVDLEKIAHAVATCAS